MTLTEGLADYTLFLSKNSLNRFPGYNHNEISMEAMLTIEKKELNINQELIKGC